MMNCNVDKKDRICKTQICTRFEVSEMLVTKVEAKLVTGCFDDFPQQWRATEEHSDVSFSF